MTVIPTTPHPRRFKRQGRRAQTQRAEAQALLASSENFDTLHLLGLSALQKGHAQHGVDLIRRAITANPAHAPAHMHLGNGYQTLLRFEEALACYEQAIALEPGLAEAHYNRGIALESLKRPAEALASYDRAIALKPDHVHAHNNRGNALQEAARFEEALASYDRAIALKPDHAAAHYNRANVLLILTRLEEALASYDTAIAFNHRSAESHYNRGNALAGLKRLREALADYECAIGLNPGFAEAYTNGSKALLGLRRFDEALAWSERAIELKPDLATAHNNRGAVLDRLKRHAEAARAYAKALELNPRHSVLKGRLLLQKMFVCDWKEIAPLIEEIERDVELGLAAAEPFGWQGVAKSPRSLQLCAERYSAWKYPADIQYGFVPSRRKRGKIRVGYVSGEFREQPIAFVLAGVFERHDRNSFEMFVFDNGWDDRSEIRGRIDRSVHRVMNIREFGDAQAAAAIYENEIDILVNLSGYIGEERTSVFARRAAPIQVNYLGYPGTLGAGYMDYILADRHVIPDDERRYFTEKVAYLPNCYQPNDREREVGAHDLSRTECGLPERGFVFCCFNNNYKIQPETFGIWMRILKHVDGSVLWLREDTAAAAANLRAEAVARGVDPDRLVFAHRAPLSRHMARHRCADLFIDTLPYNAHTTACDALWAGLPVLTCRGSTFAGRVGTSLLDAMHLRELVTTTLEDYERVAIELATDPDRLAAIRRTLSKNRLTTPLFDTALYTRHLEAVFTAMHERFRAGLAPDHIEIG